MLAAACTLAVRLLGAHGDGAAAGVLAEQGALRPAQHLDLVDVESVQQLGLHRRHHEVVDQHRHRRLEIDDDVVLADAADGEGGGVEAGDGGGREARHEHRQVAQIAGRRLLDDAGIDGADRHRRLLQPGLAPGRGHDDLGKALALLRDLPLGRCAPGCLLRPGGARKSQDQRHQRGAAQQQFGFHRHASSPSGAHGYAPFLDLRHARTIRINNQSCLFFF
jgi:hypothetical protein